MALKDGVHVKDATHVRVGGQIEKIKYKRGVGSDGWLNRARDGGFGVVTENGSIVSMYMAQSYLKEEEEK